MGSASWYFDRAVALHREAAAHTEAARAEIVGAPSRLVLPPERVEAYRRLAERLTRGALDLVPGWLGWPLDGSTASLKVGVDVRPGGVNFVLAGVTVLAEKFTAPVVVPLLGGGHVTVDADARRPEVAAWLRGVLLRLVAAVPDGALRVLTVDGGTLGAVFAPFRQLVEAELWRPPVTDVAGLHAVLDEAEAQIAVAQSGGGHHLPYLLITSGALPTGCGQVELARLAAIAHAGPAARVHLLLAGYPPPPGAGQQTPARLDFTTALTTIADGFAMSEPPGPERLSTRGSGFATAVRLSAGPVDGLIETVCGPLASAAWVSSSVDFAALLPAEIWSHSSASGLRTTVGRDGRAWCELALDDSTPHWLVGGRTGSGKTVFLLDVLYGLASRYSPDELALYLLDFKEGVSFADFTPTPIDGTWIPHARTVGIESDREYGLAVLRELAKEMGRRAMELKKAGVTRLADLRTSRPDLAMPRIVAVIDEFHVLFSGNDRIAGHAAAVLEELARKGRSYGIHLILASQTIAGVEALFTKGESIFGQFPLRVALAGGGGVLDKLNRNADNLPVGSAVINTAAGVAGANRIVRFPNNDPALITAHRHRLWHARTPGSPPPAVFAGYAEHHIDSDPAYLALNPQVRRPHALVGRAVDVGLPSAGFTLDTSPGRHIAVLGPSPIGADIVHAGAVSVARQHPPGTVTFVIACLVASADAAADATAAAIHAVDQPVELVDAAGLQTRLGHLAAAIDSATAPPTYLVVFGADAASALLAAKDLTTFRSGHDDLRTVLRVGPTRGIHLLAWWRGARRFIDDIGGSSNLEDVACLIALNIASNDLNNLTGDYKTEWHHRPNRALLIDRHDDRYQLIVPFVRPGAYEHQHH
nr:FtsK/SpoIIIE domain-containing protein [Virgisporangium aliadipatigenens]